MSIDPAPAESASAPSRVTFALAGRRVWVAGHTGLVGAAICRRLAREDCALLTATSAAVDLRRQDRVERWLGEARPDVVVVAAAKVGGILANDTRPADFLYDNLAIATNVIHAAAQHGVARLLFLGSSCVYPRAAEQPIPESALLTGPLEPTNEWYAVAKIAGVKLCQAYRRQHGCDFISAMPTNLYGPGDNFSLQDSHVLPALMRKIHDAKAEGGPVVIWGTGSPRREFLHVDDLADAIVFLLRHYSDDIPINVGTGTDVSIAELAALIAEVAGYSGGFRYDRGKPDGMPRKLLDTGLLRSLGWRPGTELRDGIASTYEWFAANYGRQALRGVRH